MTYIRLFLQTISLLFFRTTFIFFADMQVSGLRNLRGIDRSRGVIFASNHSSQIDVILIPSALPLFSRFLPMYFVSLESKYYRRFPIGKYLYGGILFDILGGITAKKGLRNYSLSLVNHVDLLCHGGSLCIFPEGQVIPGRGTGSAKGGVAYLAEATGATIVPVALSENHDLHIIDFLLLRRRMNVTFGSPTNYEEIYQLVLKDLEIAGVAMREGLDISNKHKAVAQKLMEEISQLMPVE